MGDLLLWLVTYCFGVCFGCGFGLFLVVWIVVIWFWVPRGFGLDLMCFVLSGLVFGIGGFGFGVFWVLVILRFGVN